MYVSISTEDFEAMQKVTATQIQDLLIGQYGENEIDPIISSEFMGFRVETLGYGGYRTHPVWIVKSESGEYAVDGNMNNSSELVEVFIQS